jgi:hypothetical protein
MAPGGRRSALLAVLAAAAIAGCGGGAKPDEGPGGAVRQAARAYVGALRAADWRRACALMTPGARRALAEDAGAACPRALAAGAALPPDRLAAIGRQLAGARVRVRGRAATIGPLGDAGRPLRFRRAGKRWLVAG